MKVKIWLIIMIFVSGCNKEKWMQTENETCICNYLIQKSHGTQENDAYLTLIYYSDSTIFSTLRKESIYKSLTVDTITKDGVYAGGEIVKPRNGDKNIIVLVVANDLTDLDEDSLDVISNKLKRTLSINVYYRGLRIRTLKPCKEMKDGCE